MNKQLETERLMLRKFKLSDSETMYKNWASDINVTKFMTWNIHQNVDETKNLLGFWIKEVENGNLLNWAIELKNSNQIIGNIEVRLNNHQEIGFCIGSKFWNNGYMTEACKKVISYLSNNYNMKLKAKCNIKNNASKRVLEKSGLKIIKQDNIFLYFES